MPALPLPERIHESSSKSVGFKTIIAQFSDGYSQRAPDGLNAKVESFQVSWAALTTAEKDQVVAVLDSVGGWGVLTWQPPTDSEVKKFVIDADSGYSIEYIGTRFTITTNLKQVFDL